jgi:hypothetical protein
MRPAMWGIWLLMPALLFAPACARHRAPPAAEPARWEALQALDALAEQGDQPAASGTVEALRALAPQLRQAALAAAAEPLADQAKDPATVAVLMEDLKALAAGLDQAATLPEPALRRAVAALHPHVERLAAAAGMPHSHEHEGENGAHHHDEDEERML